VGGVNPGPDVPGPNNGGGLHSLQPRRKLIDSGTAACDGKSDDTRHELGAPLTTPGAPPGAGRRQQQPCFNEQGSGGRAPDAASRPIPTKAGFRAR